MLRAEIERVVGAGLSAPLSPEELEELVRRVAAIEAAAELVRSVLTTDEEPCVPTLEARP
jgi:hypothetical protein